MNEDVSLVKKMVMFHFHVSFQGGTVSLWDPSLGFNQKSRRKNLTV